ncbi:MAG TPA: FkbM family methyltransferase [Egibacteraceae bacterium]
MRGLGDKAWTLRYLLGRRLPALAPPAGRRRLRLAGIATPITLDRDSGGLSTYYEIVRAGVYRGRPGFVPPVGGCVVDVGANLGVFSAWAAGAVGPTGHVVAIEPHPHACELLRTNLAPVAARTTVLQVGCGREDATLPLRYPPGRLAVATFAADAAAAATARVDVPVRRLDDVLDDVAVGGIDLLKIDVEGFEAEVLDGAPRTLARTARVVCEVARDRLEAVRSRLVAVGFRVEEGLRDVWGDPSLLVLHARREGT